MNSNKLNWFWLFLFPLLGLPWVILHFTHAEIAPLCESLFSGLAIVAAAFILSWATEIAQKDIPKGFSLVILALIAVLPEYAVDMVYAWQAGKDPAFLAYPAANMTGSNRLLIGLGWSAVVFFYWLVSRKTEVQLSRHNRLDLFFLGAATLYSFIIPLKHSLSLVDSVVLIGIFVLYVREALKGEMAEEEELIGPPALICCFKPNYRRLINVLLFLYAGFLIFISAEPFAMSLLQTGKIFGIDEFLLVQWIAPLASESPELIVTILFALKLKPQDGFGTLLSSKINQWTLLVGCIPIVYALSTQTLHPLPLDARQVEEIFLTAAQSFFALVVLMDFRFKLSEAAILFVLFAVQLIFPSPAIRFVFAIVYLVLGVVMLAADKQKQKSLKYILTGKE